MEEKYSVLLSLYKKENPTYLRIAIDSICNQTLLPDEIVLVEDGPLTQELYKTLESYGNKLHRIKIKKNVGLGSALNIGLKECRNELIARMDTDDISKPERCQKEMECFMQHPELSIVGTWVDEFDSTTGKIISTRSVPVDSDAIYNFAKRRSAFNHPTVMFKKSKVIENGGYGSYRRNQDVDLFGRMLFNGCKAMNIGESLLLFRCSDDLSRRRKSWENTKSYINTIKRFWKMGYSSFLDFLIVAIAQIGMFILPVSIQNTIYKIFLRK